jgi:hypothetical protein
MTVAIHRLCLLLFLGQIRRKSPRNRYEWLLRGQGVARRVHQAAGGVMVVVQVLGCRFSGSGTWKSSNSDEVVNPSLRHQLR